MEQKHPYSPLLKLKLCCLLIWLAPLQLSAQALHKAGFGDALIITTPLSYYLDTSQAVDLTRVRQKTFDLPYSSFIRQLEQDPQPYTFWIKFGWQNRSDSTLELAVSCG